QKFAVTIWWLGNGRTLRTVSELCGMAESTFHYVSRATHDSRVLRNSSFYQRFSNPVTQSGSPNSYILGDSGYANTNWLLVPYHNNEHLTIIQQYYNYVYLATHIRIEQVFVSAYCILHNICESHGDEIEESLLEADNTFKRQENIEENYNDNNYVFIRDFGSINFEENSEGISKTEEVD
ncbi:9489_t:CDS:2, partial [Ambispora leptoticha]